MAERTGEGKLVPIDWQIPRGLVPRYATNMLVQHGEHEFILSFFETWPPIVMGPPEDVEDRFRNIDSIEARCVGRVIVAADRMPGFIEALQTNLDRYLAKQEDDGDD